MTGYLNTFLCLQLADVYLTAFIFHKQSIIMKENLHPKGDITAVCITEDRKYILTGSTDTVSINIPLFINLFTFPKKGCFGIQDEKKS